MFALGARIVSEHEASLVTACRTLIREDDARRDEHVDDLCQRLAALGLLGLGRVRSGWLLESSGYVPHPTDPRTLNLLADLVIGVAMFERLVGRKAIFDEDGLALFHGPGGQSALLVASGQGVMSWERATAQIARRQRDLVRRGRTVDGAVAAGIVGSRDAVAVPENIAGAVDKTSVAAGQTSETSGAAGQPPEILSIEELRARPDLADRLVA